MPAHGPIHLPTDDEDKNVDHEPIVTTTGVAFEVIRTVAIASALGLQVYSTVLAKRHTNLANEGSALPDRTDIKLWVALGSWQAQAVYATCLVSRFSSLAPVLECIADLSDQATAIPASIYMSSSRRQTSFRRLVHSLLSGLLLAVWLSITYRTVFPLATYWRLVDPIPAWSTWSLFATNTIAAVFVPLFQPRPATMTLVDPDTTDDGNENSPLNDPTPHPQLTASVFSTAFYSFMDPVILQAFRKNSAFGAADLPPVRPSDRSETLDDKYMAVIDPIIRKQHGLRERSLAMNVLSAFKGVSVLMAGTMVVKAITEFFAPIALERLLT
jgi:hypothetical protein